MLSINSYIVSLGLNNTISSILQSALSVRDIITKKWKTDFEHSTSWWMQVEVESKNDKMDLFFIYNSEI